MVPVTAVTSTTTQCVWMSVQVLSYPTLTVCVSAQREKLATTVKMVNLNTLWFTHNIFLLYTDVDCGSLTDPENGAVNFTTTTFNSVATYSCETGYNLVDGDMMRTCLASGTWSGSNPSCKL